MLLYQKKCIDAFSSLYDVNKKEILEIGGAPPYAVAQTLMDKGAKSISTINYRSDLINKKIANGIYFFNMDARYLEFEDNSFDFVFGIAVLEHLPDIDTIMKEIHRVLRKGGSAWLHGGALWSCHHGHHIYVHVNGNHYTFNDNNPIEDWHHLILNKTEMLNHLVNEKKISRDDANSIVEYIYDDNILNRLRYEDYITSFHRAEGLTVANIIKRTWKNYTPQIHEQIQHNLGNDAYIDVYRNNSIGEIEVLFTKD